MRGLPHCPLQGPLVTLSKGAVLLTPPHNWGIFLQGHPQGLRFGEAMVGTTA